MTTILVIAKEPVAGRVKTRLHPPLSLEQAAELAAAALDDTLRVAAAVPAGRRILLFDGAETPAAAAGFEVLPQVQGPLDERLAAAFDAMDGPALLIGMDTPQLTEADIAPALDEWPAEVDAWFGPAEDGGFWALALRHPDGGLLRGVPMSREDTGAIQLARLRAARLRIGLLPTLVDVDTYEDALAVAALVPSTAFGRALAAADPATRPCPSQGASPPFQGDSGGQPQQEKTSATPAPPTP